MENIKVNNGIYNIDVNAFEVENPKALVFACHGLKSNKDINMFNVFGEKFIENNMCFYVFDLAGHGKSEVSGDYLNYEDSEAELDSVIRYACEKYKDKDIYLIGTSYGSEIVWDYENKNNTQGRIKKLVLLNSAIKRDLVINTFFRDKIEEVNKNGFIELGSRNKLKVTKKYIDGLFNVDIYSTINNKDTKRIFMHGTSDSMARYEDVVEFTNKNNIDLVTFNGEDHVFSKDADEKSAREIVKFFNE